MSRILVEAIAGRETPRRPVWIMRQAGRYLPEYRELRKKHKFEELCASPDLATEVTLQPMRRFDLDASIVFADLMSPVSALGIPFRFDPGPVVERPLRDAGQIDRLEIPEPSLIAPEVIETIGRVREALPGEKSVLGFAGAPWSLAAYLVEGRGKTGFPMLRAMAAEEPEMLSRLLDKLVDLCAPYLVAQGDAGADAVQIFDTWAGLLGRRQWASVVRPSLEKLLDRIGESGLPRILFVRGAAHLVDLYAELPCEAIAVDWLVDAAELQRSLAGRRAIQGNLDPAILLAGPDATKSGIAKLLAEVDRRGHVVNLGHGILPETPIGSVEALIEAVHAEAGPDEAD